MARLGDLLCVVLHSPGNAPDHHRRITRHPTGEWMEQIGRSANQGTWGYLNSCRYVLHDRDKKFCASLRSVLTGAGVNPLMLLAKSPNLNAYAERWVRSVKQECLSKLIVFGERSLRRALSEYVAHFQAERNHQGKSNVLLFRRVTQTLHEEPAQSRERLGGLLRYYHREAA